MREDLKPCPFCGNAGGREPEKYGVKVWKERRQSSSFRNRWAAECMNCGCKNEGWSDEAEAISQWNHREPQPQQGKLPLA
jgi:hypothetical protein